MKKNRRRKEFSKSNLNKFYGSQLVKFVIVLYGYAYN